MIIKAFRSIGIFNFTALSRTDPTTFHSLASFRYLLRRFLRFSKDLLQTEGLTTDQYQTLLAIRASPGGGRLSVRELAEQLQVKHHSTVGIVDQLVTRDLLVREVAPSDRRKILLSLTEKGEAKVGYLAPLHSAELRRIRGELMQILESLPD